MFLLKKMARAACDTGRGVDGDAGTPAPGNQHAQPGVRPTGSITGQAVSGGRSGLARKSAEKPAGALIVGKHHTQNQAHDADHHTADQCRDKSVYTDATDHCRGQHEHKRIDHQCEQAQRQHI